MGVDADLVGVITASAIVGVFLCVIVVTTSCVCYRRLESKRRKDEKRRVNVHFGWPPNHPTLQPIPNGDTTFVQANRIGGYRPRMLPANTPDNAVLHSTLSTRLPGEEIKRASDNHQTSTPFHTLHNPKANGHVFVPFSVAYSAYGIAMETPDFYDARTTNPPENSNDYVIETQVYPDRPYESTNTKQEEEMVTVKNVEPESSEANKEINGTSSDVNPDPPNPKVIKKQHSHPKMPDWMTRDYEEGGASIEIEGEGTATPANGMVEGERPPGTVSVMVTDFSVADEINDHQDPDPHAMSWSTVEESTTSIVQDYPSTNYVKGFTILDYVDPPSSSNSNANNNSSNIFPSSPRQQQPEGIPQDLDPSLMDTKAAVLKQIRQKVNESADQIPPAFTSTPRVAAEEPKEDYSSDDLLARRQRNGDDGSVDILPPAAGDLKL